jgi:hypothetical protein
MKASQSIVVLRSLLNAPWAKAVTRQFGLIFFLESLLYEDHIWLYDPFHRHGKLFLNSSDAAELQPARHCANSASCGFWVVKVEGLWSRAGVVNNFEGMGMMWLYSCRGGVPSARDINQVWISQTH